MDEARRSRQRPRGGALMGLRWLGLFALLLLATVVIAFGFGRFPLGAAEIVRFFMAAAGIHGMEEQRYETLRNLIIDIRYPRIAAAVLIGAALASAGAAFQAVFRNPLVSPGLLGVLAGAAFGASIGILMSGSWVVVQVCAFAAGLLAVLVGLGIANLFGSASIIMLVLGGVISSALFTSLLTIVKYVADPQSELPVIVYWLMGNMGMIRTEQLTFMALPVLIGVVLLSLMGRALDALSMGDDEARTLGIPVTALRYAVIGLATLISAITVSAVGMVGWVGLIIPHVARLIVGPSNGLLIPASALLGATFLVAADIAARSVASIEIPIGIVTELLGIPVFVLVLSRARKGWV
ncbi:MAG: iron ABC transporter permease, partial [Porticoccaceae bacterium]